MQGKATETRKTNIDNNKSKTTTKKHTIKSHSKKKGSTLIRLKCIWHLKDTLSEQRACHNMSNIHTAWSLFCQILAGQCTTVPTNEKAKPQKRD